MRALDRSIENGVIFKIINHVCRGSVRYPESLMNFRSDLAQKKLFPLLSDVEFNDMRKFFSNSDKRIDVIAF